MFQRFANTLPMRDDEIQASVITFFRVGRKNHKTTSMCTMGQEPYIDKACVLKRTGV